jgi:hypothetical protein
MDDERRFALALGQAVVAAWGELPQDIQQRLFEDAVVAGHRSERDESLREQLAVFLHHHHPRTNE